MFSHRAENRIDHRTPGIMKKCLFVLCTLLAQWHLAQAQCFNQPSGLVSWWQGENTYADSVGSNGGTGHSTGFVNGEVNQGFNFGGDAYIQAGTAGLPTGNSPRSMDLWVFAPPTI